MNPNKLKKIIISLFNLAPFNELEGKKRGIYDIILNYNEEEIKKAIKSKKEIHFISELDEEEICIDFNTKKEDTIFKYSYRDEYLYAGFGVLIKKENGDLIDLYLASVNELEDKFEALIDSLDDISKYSRVELLKKKNDTEFESASEEKLSQGDYQRCLEIYLDSFNLSLIYLLHFDK